jgi:hypothetical protein
LSLASSLPASDRKAIEGLLRIGELVKAAKRSIMRVECRKLALSGALIMPEKAPAEVDRMLERIEPGVLLCWHNPLICLGALALNFAVNLLYRLGNVELSKLLGALFNVIVVEPTDAREATVWRVEKRQKTLLVKRRSLA